MLKTFGTILVELADYVPADIELLFHFCYGDSNHRHVVEPIDTGAWLRSPIIFRARSAAPSS